MPQGTITETDRNFVETWANIAPSGNAIIRLDSRGVEKQEFISTPRNFLITTEERKITQDRILDPKHDPFLNGCFRPVLVPDSVDFKTNPNALSDDDIRSIFVSSELAFQEWLNTLDSPETLRRMVDMAGAEDVDISLKRYKAIGARLAEVKPPTRVTQKDRAQYDAIGGATPPAAPAERRGQGGRSQDYRTS